MNLIKIKEPLAQNWQASQVDLQDLTFPSDFAQPYFMFARIGILATDPSHPSLKKLRNFLTKLDSLVDQKLFSEASDLNNSGKKELPSRGKTIDLNQLAIFPKKEELFLLHETHQDLKKQKVQTENCSPLEMIQHLRTVRSSNRLTQERRLAELNHQKSVLDRYLAQHEVSPFVNQEEEKDVPSSTEQVLTYPRPLSQSFDIKTSKIDSQGKIDRTEAFFEDYVTEGATPPMFKALLKSTLKIRYFLSITTKPLKSPFSQMPPSLT